MKKILSLILSLVCLFSLAACAQGQDTSSANKLVYGEKYYYIPFTDFNNLDKEYQYIIFEKDSFTETRKSEKYEHDHSITYKYEIMDEGTLAYFYDSKVDPNHEIHETESTRYNGILLFSENVLSNGSNLYVLESYLDEELPNFGISPKDGE